MQYTTNIIIQLQMWKLKLSTNNAQSNLHSIIVPIYDVLSTTTHDVMFPNQGLQFFLKILN
jgi:hypothetical protein